MSDGMIGFSISMMVLFVFIVLLITPYYNFANGLQSLVTASFVYAAISFIIAIAGVFFLIETNGTTKA
jgi:hypothetical protein